MTELLTLSCPDGGAYVLSTTHGTVLGWLIVAAIFSLFFGRELTHKIKYKKDK